MVPGADQGGCFSADFTDIGVANSGKIAGPGGDGLSLGFRSDKVRRTTIGCGPDFIVYN
jgi:hypothetical protein